MVLEILRKLICRSEKAIHYIGGSDVLPPPLKGQQEQSALEALEQGDGAAKQLLVEHNLRLVVYIARRFENTGIHLEDLISIGTIGLMKAIDTYRLDRKIKLAKDMLVNTNLPIKQIASNLCYADEYYFSNVFKQKTGVSPGRYRKGM